jgi:sugar phosphate permease
MSGDIEVPHAGVEATVMTASQVQSPVLATPVSSVRWRILWLMVIGALVAYVLRLNMSIAGEAMIRDRMARPRARSPLLSSPGA